MTRNILSDPAFCVDFSVRFLGVEFRFDARNRLAVPDGQNQNAPSNKAATRMRYPIV